MAFFKAEFSPGATLGHARIDGFFDNCGANAASRLDFLPVVIKTVRYHCFGAIFVGCDLLRGKGGRIIKVFDVVGPVRAARRVK